MDGDRRRLARLVVRDGGVHRLCRNGHDLAMRKLLAAILLFVSVAALAVTRTVPSAAVTGGIETPLPIGSNYLYFANSANAIKYLNGRTISGTAPNLTGVKGIAADVQGTFRTISGTLAGSGAGQTMTIGIPFYMTVPVGEHVAFTSISPPNWNENCVVTASSPGFITCANRKASGTYSGNGLFTWNNTSIPAMLHARGIASIDFIGGGCQNRLCNERLAYQGSVRVDDIIVDEPAAGNAGWNTTMSYWQSVRPGGGFGFTTGNETCSLIESYTAAPYDLPFSYGEIEYYVGGGSGNPCGSNVKAIALLYGTAALCANSAGGWLSGFNTVAFWDVDNFGPLANPSYMDYNWLQNAQTYIQSGPTSICNMASSFYGHSTPSGNHQSGSFTVTTADNIQSSSSPLTIKACQYSVYAGANLTYGLDDPSAVQTVPWTNKPCNGATGTITVGSGGACNVNSITDVDPSNLGNQTYTCAVTYRALMSNGAYGGQTYTLFQIN